MTVRLLDVEKRRKINEKRRESQRSPHRVSCYILLHVCPANRIGVAKSNQPSVSAADEDELPEITEEFVATLTDEVRIMYVHERAVQTNRLHSNAKTMPPSSRLLGTRPMAQKSTTEQSISTARRYYAKRIPSSTRTVLRATMP
jgi:hypothetical protein